VLKREVIVAAEVYGSKLLVMQPRYQGIDHHSLKVYQHLLFM